MANKVEITISVDMENEESVQDFMDQLEKLKTAASEKTTMPVEVDVDDDELDSAKEKEESLEDTAHEEIIVDDDGLDDAKEKIGDMDGTDISIGIAMQNFTQGIATAKQGIQELKESMDEALAGAGKRETNETFLEMSIGAKDAATQMERISQVVQDLPGDDTALQGLLSSAAAKNAKMTATEMKAMGGVAADYFSAMSFYGKSSIEAQQDMTNYILAGNTAELERSPILQAHIDKLKEANTVQERTQALQEALKEEGWLDMSQADTYNNKLETFNGMLQRGQDNLGKMFMEGSKGAMDLALQLDEDTNGLVGMGIAAMSFAGPVTDIMSGIGQIGTGFRTLKDAADFTGITGKLSVLKTGLMGVGSKAKEAALSFAGLAKQVLISGYNALKSAAMWVVQKAQLVATTIAEYAAEAAQWALNIAMSANPIGIIIIAITVLIALLGYLYFNNEQVRAAIDGLGQAFMQVAGIIYTSIMNAVNQVINFFTNLWNYLVGLGSGITSLTGNTTANVINGILGFLIFFATLPIRIGVILTNTIAKALGFGNNFVQRMYSAATNAVSRFTSQITQLPGKLQSELNNMLSAVGRWASTLPQKFWDAGVNAVKNFLSALGIASPGTMQRMLVWEISEMGRRTPIAAKPLLENVKTMGQDIVDNFGNPTLGVGFDNFDTLNGNVSNGNVDLANQNNITNNFNIHGIIEEEASQFIVDSVNDHIRKQNLVRGR